MVWKDIPGYEGWYQISDTGVVSGVDRLVTRSDGQSAVRKGRIIKQVINDDGYAKVRLSKNGHRKEFFVHRLVALTYLDGYFCGAEVNHIDFNRLNNTPSNLEWTTRIENIHHTMSHQRHVTQTRPMAGKNNPNYGNSVLHKKYAENRELSIQKQSRPGIKNGRSTPVTMITSDGTEISFGYIKECAEHLISSGATMSRHPYNVSAHISRAAKNNTMYLGYRFRFE